MNKIPQLLFSYGRAIAEVSWPAYERKNGGTCDFMTSNCRKYCKLKSNHLELASFEFVEDNEPHVIIRQMIKEKLEMKATVISWGIGSGDCPDRLTEKMIHIIEELSKIGIPQNGFTRNFHVGYSVNNFKNVRFALTIEKEESKEFLDVVSHKEYLIAEPNYEESTVVLYKVGSKGQMEYATCGSGWVTEFKKGGKPPKVFVEDCSTCLENNSGCYKLVK